MPGIVESERADITVNYFVLKTTGVEELNQAILESTSYSKKTVDIVEKMELTLQLLLSLQITVKFTKQMLA